MSATETTNYCHIDSDSQQNRTCAAGEIDRINVAADIDSEKHNAAATLRVALKTVVHKIFG